MKEKGITRGENGDWICNPCLHPMVYPTLSPDGTAYVYAPEELKRIMCLNEECPDFEVRYVEPGPVFIVKQAETQ